MVLGETVQLQGSIAEDRAGGAGGDQLVIKIVRGGAAVGGDKLFQFAHIGGVGGFEDGLSGDVFGLEAGESGAVVLDQTEVQRDDEMIGDGFVGGTEVGAGAGVNALELLKGLLDAAAVLGDGAALEVGEAFGGERDEQGEQGGTDEPEEEPFEQFERKKQDFADDHASIIT